MSGADVGARPSTASRALPVLGVRLAFRDRLVAIAASGGALVALLAIDSSWLPLAVVRAILGLGFILLAPGYALQAALFPSEGDLDAAERVALSFGLSLAVLSPIAYLLNYLPGGIRLWSVAAAIALWTAGCLGIAWLRRRRLVIADDGFRLEVDVAAWWGSRDQLARVSSVALIAALLFVAGSVIAAGVLPTPGEHITEFYALGSEGLAESYPREAVVGQPVDLVVGIANSEGVAAEYRMEVVSAGRTLVADGPVRLESGGKAERAVRFVPDHADADSRVEVLLYRDGSAIPYRSLWIWMSVKAAK